MVRKLWFVVVFILMALASAQTSRAGLNAVDPGPYTDAYGFFPVWYQDTNGRGLELCLDQSLCLPPVLPDPIAPMSFPGNWPDELFWFTGDALLTQSGVDLRYVSAVEAAFGAAGGVAIDQQISFARIRIFADVPTPGTYIITHPYGIEVFEIDAVGAGREIQFTRDLGLGGPGTPDVFTGALKGDIGPYLVRVDASGNPSLITAADGVFIGDPNVAQRVTGSPFGTNFVRVQGPGIDVITDQFLVSGLVYPITLPSPLVVDRTTYSRTAVRTQLDVFATSAPTAALSFTPPDTLMGGDPLGRFFGQALVTDIPLAVDLTADNPSLNNSPVTNLGNVVSDVVSITRAEYSAGTLVIEAFSSDEINPPSLSYGTNALSPAVAPLQTFTVSGLSIPPATVTVASSAGGSDTEDVVVVPDVVVP